MGTRFKTLTGDCKECDKCKVNNAGQFVCYWGNEPKIMRQPKGKKSIKCKLTR